MVTPVSSDTDSLPLPNSPDPSHPLLTVNLNSITKLTSLNYITWSLQIRSLLEGYNLHQFITPGAFIPPTTLLHQDVPTANLDHTAWHRQDQLLFSAL